MPAFVKADGQATRVVKVAVLRGRLDGFWLATERGVVSGHGAGQLR